MHISEIICTFAADFENHVIMGTLLNVNEPKTDKGNRMYEFKRVQSDELQQYRIPSYGYIA